MLHLRRLFAVAAFLLFTASTVARSEPLEGDLSGVPAPKPAADRKGDRPESALPQPEATFREVMELILSRHVDSQLTADELYQAAIEGMLQRASLELQGSRDRRCEEKMRPSNALLSPADQADMAGYLKGRFTGLGLILDPHREAPVITVLKVVPGSPADKAGVRAGDQLIRIDGRKLQERSPGNNVRMLRGTSGQASRLTVQRGAQQLELTVVRGEVAMESVNGELLPPDIGLIRIKLFAEDTPRQLRGILLELKNRGVKGLVIDLRENGGGSLESALQVLDLFVPAGRTVLQVEDRAGRREAFHSKGTPILSVPMAVLIDGQTASGAEVVARALSENLKARLVGEQSYGKATAEEIMPLKNGYATRLSIKRLLSPQGKTWEAVGISPDVTVKTDSEALKQAFYAPTVEERLRQDSGLRAAIALLLN